MCVSCVKCLASSACKLCFCLIDNSSSKKKSNICLSIKDLLLNRGCRGGDRVVVVFTTAYAISAYHH